MTSWNASYRNEPEDCFLGSALTQSLNRESTHSVPEITPSVPESTPSVPQSRAGGRADGEPGPHRDGRRRRPPPRTRERGGSGGGAARDVAFARE
eukprot:4690481-Pyramimonas_sp.AAC.1